MVKILPSNAGDVGSVPSQETTTPLALGQLSPPAATTESLCATMKTQHSRNKKVILKIKGVGAISCPLDGTVCR